MTRSPKNSQAYARTVSGPDGIYLPADLWQPLESHLAAVATQAEEFARVLGAAEWARLAGLWHDLGKYHPEFQHMLREVAAGNRKPRVDHATAGAIHAARLIRAPLRSCGVEALHLLLTATIAGHHSTLTEGMAEIDARLVAKGDLYEHMLREGPPPEILKPIRTVPPLPARLAKPHESDWSLRLDFLIRMVFSAMVDADRLDAERVHDSVFLEERRASVLRWTYPSVAVLREAADRYVDDMVAGIVPEQLPNVQRQVHEYRQAVLSACRASADEAPGAFSLDVATGGGKTLSSLSFALRHAERHGKARVIIVIPYTSIIEQTAGEYRRAIGAFAPFLVEHHTATNEDFERPDSTGRFDAAAERRRLATENWDAPIIVTTAVQFFESLYACTPSRCRKLHNIANSVVVIDEAQMLPPDLLTPTVWAMNELVEGYGVSLVLSTATQPALERPFPEVRNLRPIVSLRLMRPPARVRIEIRDEEPCQWPALAVELASLPQVLCVTHQRRDARDLTVEIDRHLGHTETIHLSAAMCPAHRSECLEEIRRRLAQGIRCRVVSTQLIEAGVDVDFPVVYRSLAGLDSLAQAAGRANREGKLGERGGLLRVFRAPTTPPPGLLRLAAESASMLLRLTELQGTEIDIFSAESGRRYFRHYYEKIRDMDRQTTALRRDFLFQSVAREYRFIRDSGIAVAIPWDERGAEAVSEVEAEGPNRERLRRIQRYTVSIFPRTLDALLVQGAVRSIVGGENEAAGGLYVLRDAGHYDQRFGLQAREESPEDFIL